MSNNVGMKRAIDEDRSGHGDLLRALGLRSVAEETGEQYKTVHKWTTRGVPESFGVRATIARMALAADVPLPPEFLPSIGLTGSEAA